CGMIHGGEEIRYVFWLVEKGSIGRLDEQFRVRAFDAVDYAEQYLTKLAAAVAGEHGGGRGSAQTAGVDRANPGENGPTSHGGGQGQPVASPLHVFRAPMEVGGHEIAAEE